MVIRVCFLDRYIDAIVEDEELTRYAEHLTLSKLDDCYVVFKKVDVKEIVIRVNDISCIEQI